MAFIQPKCPACGAKLTAEEALKEKTTCAYCGAVIVNEKPSVPPTSFPTQSASSNKTPLSFPNSRQTPNNDNASTEGRTYINTAPNNTDKKPRKRPKLNIFLLVLGLIFYIWPGVIYFIYIKSIQSKWDENNAG